GQLGLRCDEVEGTGQAGEVLLQVLLEGRRLREVVGDEDDVEEPRVEAMAEALGESARVSGQAGEADLSLAFRALDEALPGGTLETGDVVDGVVQVDVDRVGAEPSEAPLEHRHLPFG